jgi:glyoxylase-like metal-dependent hydrolase (beta-lactamase superfamily II)
LIKADLTYLQYLATRFGSPTEWKIWISQLERLKKLEIDTIVPGHGELCSKKEIDRNIAFLRGLLEKKINQRMRCFFRIYLPISNDKNIVLIEKRILKNLTRQ